MWGLAYKDNPNFPATKGGRVLADPHTFPTQEAADKYLQESGFDWMHAVEIHDENQPVQPAKEN